MRRRMTPWSWSGVPTRHRHPRRRGDPDPLRRRAPTGCPTRRASHSRTAAPTSSASFPGPTACTPTPTVRPSRMTRERVARASMRPLPRSLPGSAKRATRRPGCRIEHDLTSSIRRGGAALVDRRGRVMSGADGSPGLLLFRRANQGTSPRAGVEVDDRRRRALVRVLFACLGAPGSTDGNLEAALVSVLAHTPHGQTCRRGIIARIGLEHEPAGDWQAAAGRGLEGISTSARSHR